MALLEGVHRQEGQPDSVVPLKVDAEGQLAATDTGTATGIGAPEDTSANSDTGSHSLISLTKRLLTKFATLGQKTSNFSVSVVPASDALTPIQIFQPSGGTVSLAVTTTSARVALPTGAVMRLSNGGSTAISVLFGDSTVTATTGHMEILPGTSESFRPLTGATHIAGIVASGTATLKITGGSGA